MKRLLLKTFSILAALTAAVVIFGLVLAYYPVPSTVKNNPVSRGEAAAMRRSFAGAHHVFAASDGETLFLRRWNPAEGARAEKEIAVLILHGITAHSGAYDNAGNILAKGGYTTFGLDYRGHGLSGGNRADCPGKERWVADSTEAVGFIKRLGYPKVVLMGHSLGVAAAIYTGKAIPGEIAGLMLLSGGYEKRKTDTTPVPLLTKARIIASSIFRPSHQAVEYYRENMTGSHDPLFNFRYTLRFLTMMDVQELVLPGFLDVPVLVAVGDRDELFTIESVKEVFDDVPGSRKQFLVLKDTNHAAFPDSSWQRLVAWLDENY